MAKQKKPLRPVIYSTFNNKKDLNKYLSKIKKESKFNRYEIKYRQKDGTIKKFRMGKKRDEVIKRARVYIKSKNNEEKFIRTKIKSIKKPSLVTIKIRTFDDEGKQSIRYIKKIHLPDEFAQQSVDSFIGIITQLKDAYAVERFTLEDIQIDTI